MAWLLCVLVSLKYIYFLFIILYLALNVCEKIGIFIEYLLSHRIFHILDFPDCVLVVSLNTFFCSLYFL